MTAIEKVAVLLTSYLLVLLVYTLLFPVLPFWVICFLALETVGCAACCWTAT